MAQKITKTLVDSITATGKEQLFWDTEIKGFGVRVHPGGVVSYIYQSRLGKGREAAVFKGTIGKHGSINPSEARDIAKEWAYKATRGINPKPRAEAIQKITLAEFCRHPALKDFDPAFEGMKPGDYFARHAELYKKESAIASDISLLRSVILPELGRKRIDLIVRKDILDLHTAYSNKRTRGNRALSLLSKIFSLAEQLELRPQNTNPCKGVRKYKEVPRDNAPTIDDLLYIGAAMNEMEQKREEEDSVLALFRALILSGCRRSELKDCRNEWVNLTEKTIKLPDSKTGGKTIRMAPALVEIIREMQEKYPESEYVFPNPATGQNYYDLKKAWKRVLQRANDLAAKDKKKVMLDKVRVHDLRHAFATIAQQAVGGNPFLVMKLLHHKDIKTTQRYLHATAKDVQDGVDATGRVISLALERK